MSAIKFHTINPFQVAHPKHKRIRLVTLYAIATDYSIPNQALFQDLKETDSACPINVPICFSHQVIPSHVPCLKPQFVKLPAFT